MEQVVDDTIVDAATYYHTLATEQRMVLCTGSGRRVGRRVSVCMCIWRILRRFMSLRQISIFGDSRFVDVSASHL